MKFIWFSFALLGLTFAIDHRQPHHSQHKYGHGYLEHESKPTGEYSHQKYQPYAHYYKICPKLSPPLCGSVEQSGRRPGSKAVYSCDEGFILQGNDTRKCLKNGKFSGTEPVCKIVTCPPPDPADPNGKVCVDKTTYLSTAVYKCNKGYLLDYSQGGSQVVVCQADGSWSDTAPGCLPVDCGHLPAPINGFVTFAPDTTLNSEAQFSCKRGFKLVGTDVRVCECDGWSLEQPTCEKITCPKLEAPKYGKVAVYGYCVDDYAVYKCDYGYELSHKDRRICQEDGTWSSTEPECVERPKKYYPVYGHGKPYSYSE